MAGTISANTIAVTAPFGTDRSLGLTPIIIHTGVSISPSIGVAQNFTNPKVYTVTAADNSTKVYTVTVTVAEAPRVYVPFETGPGGGVVFYDKGSYSNGWRYLEAAPSDQSPGIQWYNGVYLAITYTTTILGSGQANTTDIVASQGTGNYAARLCNNLVIDTYTDWFLPSSDELNLMYTVLKVNGLGGFAGGSFDKYWSSSTTDINTGYNAHLQWFVNGTRSVEGKHLNYRVRCARAF